MKIKTMRLFVLAIAVAGGVSAAQIEFNVTYSDAAGSGFFDPVFGADRRTAFDYACGIWSGYLGASYVGETINISASFSSMGGTSSSATLGSAGPESFSAGDFGLGPTGYLWMNAANANHMFGGDQNDSQVEISAQFNSDVDNGTVLGATDFYYGLDGNCGNDIDFVSVLLHEIGHGLGFTSLIDPSSGAYYTLHSAIPNTPGMYDYFLGQDNGDGSYTDLFGMTDADRLAAATSGELYWLGANAMAANGGDAVHIFAPDPWEQGSSLSHEDEGSYPDALMSPYYSGALHTPDDITLGMLADMGWDVIPEPGSVVLLVLSATGFLGIRRIFMIS